MGVRHLQTFIERKVQGGTYPVQMDREIKGANTRVKKPLIVIDLMGFFAVFCRDKYSLLCGSQITLVERMADEFFRRLTDIGAELVFFYDGSLQPSKYETWMGRQNSKYENMIAIIDAIDQGTPLPQVVHRFERDLPNNTGVKLKRVAKQHGKMIISVDVECDQALVSYAVHHKALAIIAQDTDFLIYQGDWQLWSANHINLTTLKTMGYNRKALLQTLNLQWNQIAVFATLAGNDFFKYETVEPFLNSLGPYHQKFYNLAEYVRSLPQGRELSNNMIDRIVAQVFNGRTIPPEANANFKQSLAFYKTDSKSLHAKPTMDPITSFLLNNDQHFVNNILAGRPFNCTLYFFDYRSPAFGSYFEIIERIISRIAGIILLHHQHEGQRHVLVVTKCSHEEPHAKHILPAEFPTRAELPSIMELHSPDPYASENLLQQKLELLAWVCSDNLPFEAFTALPAPLMVTIMALFRLTECGALILFEADLLLWIAHELSIDSFDPSAERRPYRLDPRAFRIAFLFQKVYAHCARAAKALGLPRRYRPSTPFDGLRFHNQYSAWRNGHVQHHIQSIADWRLYRNNDCSWNNT